MGSAIKWRLRAYCLGAARDEVTIDRVTFTKKDVLGLLTLLPTVADGTDFVGNRFDDRPDVVVTKDGRQLHGKFKHANDETFREGEDMWRWDGDFMVLTDPFPADRIKGLLSKNSTARSTFSRPAELHIPRQRYFPRGFSHHHAAVVEWGERRPWTETVRITSGQPRCH